MKNMQLKFADVWHQKELDTFQAFPEYGMLTLGNWESGTRQIHTSLVDRNNLLRFFFNYLVASLSKDGKFLFEFAVFLVS